MYHANVSMPITAGERAKCATHYAMLALDSFEWYLRTGKAFEAEAVQQWLTRSAQVAASTSRIGHGTCCPLDVS